jgi:hypothetical protein
MKFKFEDIEMAYDFVSSSLYGDHSAVLRKDSGKILWQSESGDMDESSEEDWESYDSVEIPHKNDLNLGKRLVFDFVLTNLPNDFNHVRQIFRRRGAYGRFKEFVESKGLLQSWYDFEAEQKERALRQWCEDNGIELTD